MDTYRSAAELLRRRQPDKPVLCLRPHAAERAAAWFQRNFPGTVVYALKANDSPVLVEALARAGIRHFDVASLQEAERAARLSDARLYLMNPVHSRAAVARGYFALGVRSFALDSEAELEKIIDATNGARDLDLYVRLACPNRHSVIPLEGKFGAGAAEAPRLLMRARGFAARLGVTFHVGSQAMHPASFGEAIAAVDATIRRSGALVDLVDVGGGFPSRYPGLEPPPLAAYLAEIERAAARMAVSGSCALLAEPGRALVAEAESVLVQVIARRAGALYINDGAFGTLYDAAHSGFAFPVRLVRPRTGAVAALKPFSFYGPTCDSVDFMPGPFLLPDCVGEGDYIEIGQVGAYGRVMRSRFNGFGAYEEAVLTDAPMLTMYPEGAERAVEPEDSPAAAARG